MNTNKEVRQDDPFIKKHLASIKQKTKDLLIAEHIGKMYSSLSSTSIKHFLETGSINGSFRESLLGLMDAWKKYKLDEPVQSTSESSGVVEYDCQHEPLTDTGVGYYHCPACGKSWTYGEWGKPTRMPLKRIYGPLYDWGNGFDTAITLANNICVQKSDEYNNDDFIKEANATTQLAKEIRKYYGDRSFKPEEIFTTSSPAASNKDVATDSDIKDFVSGIYFKYGKLFNEHDEEITLFDVVYSAIRSLKTFPSPLQPSGQSYPRWVKAFTEIDKARFWSKVKDTGYCWEWLGNKDSCGYGMFKIAGKGQKASRISYQLINGEIFDNLHVLHKCDNPCCVNPDHLFTGTHQDNMLDKQRKGRGRHLGRRSQYYGVGWRNDSNNWRAYIYIKENGKRKHISVGGFDTEIEAAKARDQRVLELKLDLPLNFKL